MTPTQNEYRFLQADSTASETCTSNTSGDSQPESDCYCPLLSVVLKSSFLFNQTEFVQVIVDLVQQQGADFIITGAEFITQVECQPETTFTTLITFKFSAFQWIIYNLNDVQVLGNQIAKADNNLVLQYCDQ